MLIILINFSSFKFGISVFHLQNTGKNALQNFFYCSFSLEKKTRYFFISIANRAHRSLSRHSLFVDKNNLINCGFLALQYRFEMFFFFQLKVGKSLKNCFDLALFLMLNVTILKYIPTAIYIYKEP
jgi:hypothetical protein